MPYSPAEEDLRQVSYKISELRACLEMCPDPEVKEVLDQLCDHRDSLMDRINAKSWGVPF